MLGRGIDQILPCPLDPRIPERWVSDARDYVRLAEEASGPIPRSVPFDYIWGDLRQELERMRPAARIVNLETSITDRGAPWPDKAVHYRMNPANIEALSSLGVDVCTLANNHVLDYGYNGLEDTLAALAHAGIGAAGAGRTLDDAQRPIVLSGGQDANIIVLSIGTDDCGIPIDWQARRDRPGVDFLADFSRTEIDSLCSRLQRYVSGSELVITSIHWGSNWGYSVPRHHVMLAHRLIDAGVDVVYGHSSHHPRPIERYRGRLVLYGCGDLIDDYEGIAGREQDVYRGELTLSYFPRIDSATGELLGLEMSPMRIRKMRLERALEPEVAWLRATLDRECARFGTRIARNSEGNLVLAWD